MANNKSSRLYSDGTNWKATSVTGVNLLGCGLGVWFFRFLSLTYFDMTTSLASTSEAFHFFFFLENWISKTIKSGLVHAIFHACKMSSWEYFVKYKTLQNPFRFRFTGLSDWMVKSDDRFSFIFCRIIGLLLTICTGHLHLQRDSSSGNTNVLEFWARAVRFVRRQTCTTARLGLLGVRSNSKGPWVSSQK